MNHNFTVEEVNLICVFASESGAFTLESRSEVIKDIERALPYLEDTYMEELSISVVRKLHDMTDEEFEWLELAEAD